jgi:hypothetical protein
VMRIDIRAKGVRMMGRIPMNAVMSNVCVRTGHETSVVGTDKRGVGHEGGRSRTSERHGEIEGPRDDAMTCERTVAPRAWLRPRVCLRCEMRRASGSHKLSVRRVGLQLYPAFLALADRSVEDPRSTMAGTMDDWFTDLGFAIWRHK